jgi:hypothetical protein
MIGLTTVSLVAALKKTTLVPFPLTYTPINISSLLEQEHSKKAAKQKSLHIIMQAFRLI